MPDAASVQPTAPHTPGRTLATLSWMTAGLWLMLCGWLVADEMTSTYSGFLSGLGYALAGLLALIGNAVSLILHGVYWYRFGAPGWLKVLVALQSMVVAGTVVWLGWWGVKSYQERNDADRRSAVYDAITRNDADALALAWSRCTKEDCGSGSLEMAADHGALRAAEFLIAKGQTVSSDLGRSRLDMRTCEGDYLPSLTALEVAVARDDAAMVGLLFPVSDEGTRRRALWKSARLDRLARLQQLLALGVPIHVRGEILDENNTLLVAAAQGAALNTGRWLIEHERMPANAMPGPDVYPGMPPMHALFQYMSSVRNSPRALPFMRMLVAHGARIDEPRRFDGTTLLQEAIRVRDPASAVALIAAGARENPLSATERDALHALLDQPDSPSRAESPQRCVPITPNTQ